MSWVWDPNDPCCVFPWRLGSVIDKGRGWELLMMEMEMFIIFFLNWKKKYFFFFLLTPIDWLIFGDFWIVSILSIIILCETSRWSERFLKNIYNFWKTFGFLKKKYFYLIGFIFLRLPFYLFLTSFSYTPSYNINSRCWLLSRGLCGW